VVKKTKKELADALRKKKREGHLLLELQRDHGYMFVELSRKSEQWTNIVQRMRCAKKLDIIAARAVKVIFPVDSWMGEQAAARDKAQKMKTSRA
jgi:hypothetical protein